MLLWQTLAATPIKRPVRRQSSSPFSVLLSTFCAAAPFVADDLGPFDADERGDVAEPRQLARDVVGDQLAVGEDLEIAVRMRGEDIEELRMQERLAAQDAEVAVAVRLGVADDAIQLFQRELLRRRLDVDPAALAAQLAARDYRDEEERREVLAALAPPLVQLDRAHALDPEVVDELREHFRPASRSARVWSGPGSSLVLAAVPGGRGCDARGFARGAARLRPSPGSLPGRAAPPVPRRGSRDRCFNPPGSSAAPLARARRRAPWRSATLP